MADIASDRGTKEGPVASKTVAGVITQQAGTHRSATAPATEPSASSQTAGPLHGGRPKPVLQILDVPFSGKRPELLMTLFKEDGNADSIRDKLAALPEHKNGFARVFYFNKTDQPDLEDFISSLFGDNEYFRSRWESGLGENNICNISYQWSGKTGHFADYLTAKTAFAKRTSAFLTDNEFTPPPPEITFLRCFNEDDDKLVVVNTTVSRPHLTYNPRDSTMFERLISERGFSAMANGTRDQFTKLLVLDFFASSIYLLPNSQQYLDDIIPLGHGSLQAKMILGLWYHTGLSVPDYMAFLQLIERILEDLHQLTEAIDFIADTLLKNYPTPEVTDQHNSVNGYAAGFHSQRVFTLQKLCHQRLNNTKRYIERLNRMSEGEDRTRNRQESNGVKRLTLLATIFLPLSLSASILSMNNRFVDIKVLLYDFLGVFVIMGSLAVIMLILVRIALKIKTTDGFQAYLNPSATWRDAKGRNAQFKWAARWLSVLVSILYTLILVVLLVSFIVGMTIDRKKGLLILGFGCAGLLGYTVIGYVIWISGFKWALRRRLRKQE